MNLEEFISHLQGVKQTAPRKWMARCPAHDDHSPSLAIAENAEGAILLRCFAECSAVAVLDALNLNFADLYPSKRPNVHSVKSVRKFWNANDVLYALAYETLVAYNIVNGILIGLPLTDDDRARLLLCASRFQRGLEVMNG